MMQTIDQYNFAGKKALIRVDFNVPLDNDKNVTDDTRIKAAIPTIKKVLNDGGSAILMSHLGRPKGKINPEMSLKYVIKSLSQLIPGVEVKFASDCSDNDAREKSKNLKPRE